MKQHFAEKLNITKSQYLKELRCGSNKFVVSKRQNVWSGQENVGSEQNVGSIAVEMFGQF